MTKKGQALVEFALFLPIIIILFMLLVEAAFCLHSYAELVAKTREISRYAGKGYDFFGGTTTVETSSVFTKTRELMGAKPYSLRVTYVTIEAGEITEVITDLIGGESSMPSATAQLIEEQAAAAKALDKPPPTGKAIWAVVDAVQDYEPVFWMDLWPARELKARSVFRVTLHIRRNRED
jgi:hypothetical protein